MEYILHNNIKFKMYINNNSINKRISEIANEINSSYSENNKNIIFVGVLNGCFYFMNDLLNKINFNYEYQFIKISSYKGMNSKKLINESNINKELFIGKDIIIIEDIIDSGKTIKYIKKYFSKMKVNSLKIVTLLIKEKRNKLCDWFGFKINNKFVIGYGLDIDNQYRNLKDIYIKD